MLPIPLITLTTDFGEGSPYVTAMKGVIFALNPAVRLVDVTHAVPPQDVRRGAILLDEITPLYPSCSAPRGRGRPRRPHVAGRYLR